MKNLQTPTSLISLHIPKTGSTTLDRIINRMYPNTDIYTIDGSDVKNSLNNFKALSEADRSKIRCLKGHMPFGLHPYLNHPCKYISIMREPVDRLISHYYYVLRKESHYLHDEVISNCMSFSDYIGSGLSTELRNGQTRLLCGYEENPPSNMIQLAKNNLKEHFIGIGTTDKFDEFIIYVARIMGWKRTYYVKANVSTTRPSRSEILPATLRIIEETNEYDIELYQYAQKLSMEMIKNEGENFSREVTSFQRRRRIYSCIINALGKAKSVPRKLCSRSKL